MERKPNLKPRVEQTGVIPDIVPDSHARTAIHRSSFRLFPLAAGRLDDLLGMVKLLRLQVEKNPDLVELSQKWFEVYIFHHPQQSLRV